MKALYTASAMVTGNGRDGHGRTSDGALNVDLVIPGSDRPGTNPEQLFALGYSACFLSALKSIAKTEKRHRGRCRGHGRRQPRAAARR